MNAKPSETKLPKPSFASCVSQSYVVYGTTNHASHRWFPWRKYWCADDAYSQLQMSADKSWGRVAGLSLSAAWIQRGMQGRDAEENRAAVLTLVCGHLELTIYRQAQEMRERIITWGFLAVYLRFHLLIHISLFTNLVFSVFIGWFILDNKIDLCKTSKRD
ncbi:hypothetical protein Y032_0204g1884 [Ancylostoma ceylanicum]|uniref:Uncharacterized protein n=1 Tax=Ancylostoma ceylanicum TaxID=53326 RepID=A0A016SLW7_9BILA|nr:hypothetical protein Y032_0204g1884 [Ancylostoma ceylanicum]